MSIRTDVPHAPAEAPAPFDPFELEDTVSGTIRDPYPAMAELRRQSPVHIGPIDLGEGAEAPDPSRPQPVTVLGFDEAVQVLRDNETFSSTVYEGIMGEVMGRTILQMDEPEHRIHRALVSPTFRSKVLERWEGDLVQRVVNELIDDFAHRGSADLVQELTFNFPVQVIAQILGLPRADFPTFQRWAIAITSVASNWDRGVAASASLRDYFAAVLDERRLRPADDLISDLLSVEVEGRRLDDEEIYSFLRLLLPAGVETTYRASGNLLYGLLTNPDQLRAVQDDRSLVPVAFEEAIRWEPPVTVILRRATRDTDIGGVPSTSTPTSSICSGSPARAWASVSACTCALACIWPAWRSGWPSTRSSIDCPTCGWPPHPIRICISRGWRSGHRSPCRSPSPRVEGRRLPEPNLPPTPCLPPEPNLPPEHDCC
jgi:cytochrome P450